MTRKRQLEINRAIGFRVAHVTDIMALSRNLLAFQGARRAWPARWNLLCNARRPLFRECNDCFIVAELIGRYAPRAAVAGDIALSRTAAPKTDARQPTHRVIEIVRHPVERTGAPAASARDG